MDRLVHMLASGILANAYLRWMYVGYMILLHLMVFFMLLDAGHRYVITLSTLTPSESHKYKKYVRQPQFC